MRIITMLLLTTFLVSCKTKIICAEIKRNKFKAVPFCDISFKPVARCRCRCFDLNDYETVEDLACGENFTSGNFPLEECDQIAGPSLQDWAVEIRPKIKRYSQVRDTYCK